MLSTSLICSSEFLVINLLPKFWLLQPRRGVFLFGSVRRDLILDSKKYLFSIYLIEDRGNADGGGRRTMETRTSLDGEKELNLLREGVSKLKL